MTETYTIKEAWENACKEEGVPPDSKFVVFSENNYWAKRYDKAVQLYFKSQQMMHQLNS
jgi:hypothetical protein